MSTLGKAEYEKAVLARLNEIADHFAIREDLCGQLSLYKQADTNLQTPKRQDFDNLISSIHAEEVAIFQNLVTLKNDVEEYFKAHGLNKDEIEMVTAFKPFRLATNFIKRKEKLFSLITKVDSSVPSDMTPFLAYISIAGRDPDLFPVIELILDLMKMWDMFLVNHTKIDIRKFEQDTWGVKNKKTVHSSPLPKGFISKLPVSLVPGPFKRLHTAISENDKRKITLERDITDRLNLIAFHFEERNFHSKSLRQFSTVDKQSQSPRYENLERLLTRIEKEEIDALYELVHLEDNIKKYLAVIGSEPKEINAIDKFKSFRIAANYVNTHKHGIRGKNSKSAKHDYTFFFSQKRGEDDSHDDPIIGVENVINFDGSLFRTTNIILDLIIAWEMVIKYHTKIDAGTYFQRIDKAREENSRGAKTYRLPDLTGIEKDAKRLSEERKKLDID